LCQPRGALCLVAAKLRWFSTAFIIVEKWDGFARGSDNDLDNPAVCASFRNSFSIAFSTNQRAAQLTWDSVP
jgi:hypothetical protein